MNRNNTERFVIGDGIGLNFIPNDRYKTNYVSFYFVTPLNEKTASYNSLLSRVLTRGCEKYPTQLELNRAQDMAFDAELDSDAVKVGEWHALAFSLCLLSDEYTFGEEGATKTGLNLLREVMFSPYLPNGSFDEDYVSGEKKRIYDDIAALINHKARYAKSRMIGHMCRLEPYSICSLGTKKVLSSITAEDLTAYYKELLETARVEIFFVGRFDRDSAVKSVTEMFSSGKRRPEALPPISIRTKARSLKEVTERMDISQANLVMGFRTGTTVYDEDRYALSVYNSVLGGSLTSKLFCVLREKMSLCYSVSSSPDALKGILTVYAGIAGENREISIKEALNQMEEIRKGNVTEEELFNAKGAIINAMNGLGDTPSILAEWYLPRVLTDRKETPEQVAAKVRAVTLEDVIRVSEKITADTFYTLMPKEGEQ